MFNGICPRGSSSAPGSGNIGINSGSSAGPRYSALIGIRCLVSEIRELSHVPLAENEGHSYCISAPLPIEVVITAVPDGGGRCGQIEVAAACDPVTRTESSTAACVLPLLPHQCRPTHRKAAPIVCARHLRSICDRA